MQKRRALLTLGAVGLLTSCSKKPPVTAKTLPSPVISQKSERLEENEMRRVLGDVADHQPYKVGPGDSLLVAVYGHPELSIAEYAGNNFGGQDGRAAGFVVDNDGTIQFPLIGSVKVVGQTMGQLRNFLERELGAYVLEPKVTVQVVFTGSIRYYLLGQFSNPGLKYSDRPLHLLEALSLGGSIQLERASLRTAYVARNGKRLPINFSRLIRQADLRHNIPLKSGDIVLVPDSANEQAFVFGGAPGGTTRGGAVPFMSGRLTLLQALAHAGFGFKERTQGRLSDVRVIRSEGDLGELFIVNARKIIQGEAAPFELAPGDVVFVPMSGLTSWNQAFEQLLPTLQVISGLLQPFVQIKYLSE